MAKYSVRDVFGRFSKLVGGQPQQREAPLRDALGHYVSAPEKRPIIPPALEPIVGPGRFIDVPLNRQQREFQEAKDRALDPRSLLDKPDISQYVYDYEAEWLPLWDAAPVEDMSDGQIYAFVDTVIEVLNEGVQDWDEIWAEIMDDYWDWFRVHYKEQ